MLFDISLSKLNPQRISERLSGYKWLLLGQILVVLMFLVVYEFFYHYPFDNWQKILMGIIGILMIGMNYLSFELIKDLTDSKIVIRTMLVLLWIGVLMSLFVGFEILERANPLNNVLSIISMFSSLLAFLFLFYLMLYDIFNEKHDINYRLWGSASIYFLIGSIFGLLYMITGILFPEQFQFGKQHDMLNFIPCLTHSFYILSGIDSPYEGFSLLIKNISVFESLLSNLYIVLVVGKLLSK